MFKKIIVVAMSFLTFSVGASEGSATEARTLIEVAECSDLAVKLANKYGYEQSDVFDICMAPHLEGNK
ncbi:hypothetical protein [Vibrio crassostreae]|uniref:hypothetical protein n=1 Tax=Vibrio crassostreae TaxID=246167 RepID=UPI001B307965|nr:hypothetical protein [Vibrio crassostreae]